MFKQIRYFQAVVRCGSFTEAAEECYISQSAISQQIQALEQELGIQLLERRNRKFSVTPAGEYFYKKSLVLTADLEKLCRETVRIAHEEDDQRRAFSDEYVNSILTTSECCIEVAGRSPIAGMDSVNVQDLKDIPCILVASQSQRENEQTYYRDIVGINGDFLFAENLEEARLLVIGGKGFMPVEGRGNMMQFGTTLHHVQLLRNGKPIKRNYCAFWKADNSGYYVEEFAGILKAKFDNV